MSPPENAIVLCVDEKSQIQALDRLQPIFPMRPGIQSAKVMTTSAMGSLHCCSVEYQRRKSHQRIASASPSLPNSSRSAQDRSGGRSGALRPLGPRQLRYAQQPKVRAWLARHPRFELHFIPTSSSWLNQVERLFAEITRKSIRRGAFTSVADLERAIEEYLIHHNRHAKPFVWTASADSIFAKLYRTYAANS